MLGELLNTATPLLVAATEGTDEGLSPLVKIVPGLMIWTILAFGVSMLILRKYAWPPISKMLDERQALINDSITSAEKTRRGGPAAGRVPAAAGRGPRAGGRDHRPGPQGLRGDQG